MGREEKVKGVFTFHSFVDHFPDGDDSDKTVLVSDNFIKCHGGQLQLKLSRKSGKIGMRIWRCDAGVPPLKISCKLGVNGSKEYVIEATFLPNWCKKAWGMDSTVAKKKDRIGFGGWGWSEGPITMAMLKGAAAVPDGILKVHAG